jgi:hypothetical protein
MQYAILIYGNEQAMMSADKASTEAVLGAYRAYTDAVQQAGILVGANRLRPSQAATTVRIAEGKSQVLNGPYADTKEQLGGYYIVDVADLDAAIAWGSRCPGAQYGTIEVRPIWEMTDY